VPLPGTGFFLSQTTQQLRTPTGARMLRVPYKLKSARQFFFELFYYICTAKQNPLTNYLRYKKTTANY